ncbi:MAG: alkaline phosphatase D family protein [Desulfobacterales bacterium]
MRNRSFKEYGDDAAEEHVREVRTVMLKDMTAIGRVGRRWAQIWVRSHMPGQLEAVWRPEDGDRPEAKKIVEIPEKNHRDNTCTFRITVAAPENLKTPAPRRYRFTIRHLTDRHIIGEGTFETAPEDIDSMPKKFSVAMVSCNQPFDNNGRLHRKSVEMLRASLRCLREHDTKFVFMMGDQLYSDYPESLSLFHDGYFERVAPKGRRHILDCSAAEVRSIYHHRYRWFWNLADWRTLQNEFPCYPIPDDHDLIDNRGSKPEHQESAWRTIGEGARSAYYDYQGSRVLAWSERLPSSFHYSFSYGHTAGFVMDLRSRRRAGENGRLYDDRQESDLYAFFQRHRDKHILLIVLSVPVIHLPRMFARFMARLPHSAEDFSDRWSSGAHLADRDRFIRIIHTHLSENPSQRIILLSGDIHIGCAHRIEWKDGTRPVYQLISSPITHVTPWYIQSGSKILIRLNQRIVTADSRLDARVRLLKGVKGARKNPVCGLNLGLLEIETPSKESEPRLRFSLYGNDGMRPVCRFCTELV